MRNKISNISGLSGQEEFLAIKMLNSELEKLNQFFPDLKDPSNKYPRALTILVVMMTKTIYQILMRLNG